MDEVVALQREIAAKAYIKRCASKRKRNQEIQGKLIDLASAAICVSVIVFMFIRAFQGKRGTKENENLVGIR